jgi:hypothetical protein
MCDLGDWLAIVIIALCVPDPVSGRRTMMGNDWPLITYYTCPLLAQTHYEITSLPIGLMHSLVRQRYDHCLDALGLIQVRAANKSHWKYDFNHTCADLLSGGSWALLSFVVNLFPTFRDKVVTSLKSIAGFGVFVKWRKATIRSSYPSGCLSVRPRGTTRLPLDGI